jgi:hypothetical protein
MFPKIYENMGNCEFYSKFMIYKNVYEYGEPLL